MYFKQGNALKNLSQNELFHSAKECYNRGEFKKATVILSEIVETDEKNIDAFFYLANIFHNNGELSKAIKAFEKVLKLDSSHTDAAIALSVLYNDIGHYEEGQKVFDKAKKRIKTKNGNRLEDRHINKKFSLKHHELADLYLTYDRFDEALFEYNKAAALDTENLKLRVKIAKVFAKKGFASKAFEVLRTLKNEHPSYQPAKVALGVLYYGKGDVLKAQNEWEDVLSRDPLHTEASMYINLSKTATETTL